MRLLILLSLLVLSSCASTQKIKENLYMASCDGVFGDCKGEMEAQCPGGYKVLAKRTEYHPQSTRDHIHFECTETVGLNK